MKLTNLKPRLATIRTERVRPVEQLRPDATQRQRGRGWLARRGRWLSDRPLCQHCMQAGRITAAEEVDHVVPLWRGGADDESNYQSLCVPCHQRKTAGEATDRGMGGLNL